MPRDTADALPVPLASPASGACRQLPGPPAAVHVSFAGPRRRQAAVKEGSCAVPLSTGAAAGCELWCVCRHRVRAAPVQLLPMHVPKFLLLCSSANTGPLGAPLHLPRSCSSTAPFFIAIH